MQIYEAALIPTLTLAQDAGFHPTFRDSTSGSRSHTTESNKSVPEGLPPTQKISQVSDDTMYSENPAAD
jgi:hypothetical protein